MFAYQHRRNKFSFLTVNAFGSLNTPPLHSFQQKYQP